MTFKIRSIDDCIEALEGVSDRVTKGTLTVAAATVMLRTVEGQAKLIGMKGDVLKLGLDARRAGISAPGIEPQSAARELLDIREAQKLFRATLKRVKKELKTQP
jgi:hypothetical protein